jgi:acetyl-CoA acetyltransferase
MVANGAREALIVGVGPTPFGKREGIVSLATAAARDALDDSGVLAERVQAIYLGNFIGERLAAQGSLAPVVAGRLGLTGVPATKVEGACVRVGWRFATPIWASRWGSMTSC